MTHMFPLNNPPSTLNARSTAVRPAMAQDLPGIVKIHEMAFSHFFLTRLGSEFLRRYYRLVLNYANGIVLVSGGERGIDGFVCGFVDPAEFYREMWRARSAFMTPAFFAMLRRPSLAAGVLYGVHRVQRSASLAPPHSCELSSIAVAPEAAGNSVGKELVKEFLARAWARDARYVYLTTDADGNDSANAFYRKSGFEHRRRFLQRKGRWMNEYVMDRGVSL